MICQEKKKRSHMIIHILCNITEYFPNTDERSFFFTDEEQAKKTIKQSDILFQTAMRIRIHYYANDPNIKMDPK
jgi:hypothetical protein